MRVRWTYTNVAKCPRAVRNLLSRNKKKSYYTFKKHFKIFRASRIRAARIVIKRMSIIECSTRRKPSARRVRLILDLIFIKTGSR